jgi:hypothetical protein
MLEYEQDLLEGSMNGLLPLASVGVPACNEGGRLIAIKCDAPRYNDYEHIT